jgi:hypothetical protein
MINIRIFTKDGQTHDELELPFDSFDEFSDRFNAKRMEDPNSYVIFQKALYFVREIIAIKQV